MPPEESREFLNDLFMSILDSILFDTQNVNVIQAFTKDPAMAQLTRGFVLAQRVMLSFNLHPVVLPDLKPMAGHHLWEFWEIALDFAVTMNTEEALSMIFKLFVSSFKRFPNTGYFPIFSFFLRKPSFHDEICKILFDYLDSTDGAAENAAHSSVADTIMNLLKPSPVSLLVLAKILATGSAPPFDQQTSFNFASSSNTDVLKYGMLAMCCAINNQNLTSFNRLIQLCIDHAQNCAPFSALFLGLLIERAGRLMNHPPFADNFLPLLKSEKEDVRATSVYVLGISKIPQYITDVAEMLEDSSPFVRLQSFYSLLTLMRVSPKEEILAKMEALQNDPDPTVKNLIIDAIPLLHEIKKLSDDPFGMPVNVNINGILQLLVNSVRSPGLLKRLEKNVFDLKIQ